MSVRLPQAEYAEEVAGKRTLSAPSTGLPRETFRSPPPPLILLAGSGLTVGTPESMQWSLGFCHCNIRGTNFGHNRTSRAIPFRLLLPGVFSTYRTRARLLRLSLNPMRSELRMSDAAEIEIVREFDPALIGRCRALDARVYDEKYQTDESAELRQIRQNPRSRVVVHYQAQIVGYIEFIPITPEGFETFLNTRDTVFDLLITEQIVSPWRRDCAVDIYIASMVVHPAVQSKGISMVLLQGFYQALVELEREQYRLGRIGATGVSVPGRRFLQSMLGLPLAHEVPGGITGVGNAGDLIRYLSAYLDW